MAYLRKHHGRLLDVVKRKLNVALTTIEELHLENGIPSEEFIIVSCLAPTNVLNMVFGDYIPFDVDAGCFKKSVLDELKQLVLEGKKKVIMVYPQRYLTSWNFIEGFEYIELPEFYGTYWDFFRYYQPIDFEKIDDVSLIKKHYVSLNKRLTDARILISHHLDVENLLDKGHVSFLAENNQRVYPDCELYQEMADRLAVDYPWITQTKQIKQDTLPYRTDKKNIGLGNILDIKDTHTTGGGWITSTSVYQTSFVDVAVESFYSVSGAPIFTEKIFKPIYHQRPFLMLGAPGTLSHLRELGFKTFGKWFDESYDFPGDPLHRAMMVANEIKRICEISISDLQKMLVDMRPVLHHNRRRLEELSWELDARTIEIDNWIIQRISGM